MVQVGDMLRGPVLLGYLLPVGNEYLEEGVESLSEEVADRQVVSDICSLDS